MKEFPIYVPKEDLWVNSFDFDDPKNLEDTCGFTLQLLNTKEIIEFEWYASAFPFRFRNKHFRKWWTNCKLPASHSLIDVHGNRYHIRIGQTVGVISESLTEDDRIFYHSVNDEYNSQKVLNKSDYSEQEWNLLLVYSHVGSIKKALDFKVEIQAGMLKNGTVTYSIPKFDECEHLIGYNQRDRMLVGVPSKAFKRL